MKWFIALIAFGACTVAAAQQIDPQTQIYWPRVSGAGAPVLACTSANFSQPYTDTTNNAVYFCSTSGWVKLSSGSGTVSSGTYLHIPYYTVNPSGATLGADSVATTDGSGNLNAASLNGKSISNVAYASQFTGADAGAKIAAALASVNNNGTVVADFSGAQTMAADPFAGINKTVTLKFTGCATFVLTAGMTLNGTYNQSAEGAGAGCTVLEDGANNITVLNESGATKATDLSITYNGHTGVVPLSQHSNAIAQRVLISGGFPQYGLLRSGGPGTGIYEAHTSDVRIVGTGTAPQYGVYEFSSTPGYVGLNEDDNLSVTGTSVAAAYYDGGDSGGTSTCNNCDLEGNSGLGLWVEDAIVNIQGDCEGNTQGNIYINPANLLNAAATIHCNSAQDIFHTFTNITGTIANSSSSLTVSDASAINPGVVLNVAGATFSDTGTTYERVAGVSGTTVTLAHPTTSSGGVTGASIFGPVTPQYLQNGPGYPSTFSTEMFTEQQKFLESPYIRRPWIESPVSIRPNINLPTEADWRLCGGTAGNSCTNAMTDLKLFDNTTNHVVADFSNSDYSVRSEGGFGITACCLIITPTGDVNVHGVLEQQGVGLTDSSKNILAGGGTNIVYRCTVAGTLPVGALTTNTADCGASGTADTGLRVK